MENENQTNDAPRRGRPPNSAQEPKAVQGSPDQDKVRVTMLRGYVPRNAVPDETGTYPKALPGSEIVIPIKEAMFLCSHGIAKMEERNVDN